MNTAQFVWAVVMLIVFAGAHYATSMGYETAWTWIGIAVIINIMNYYVGRSGMKKAVKGVQEAWMSIGIFGLITTIIVALGFVPVSHLWLMSLWLLLIGAGIFATGLAAQTPLHTYSGVVLLISALFVPGFGDQWYFIAGALFFGLMGIINSGLVKDG